MNLQNLKNSFLSNGIPHRLLLINVFVFLISIPFYFQFKDGYFSFPNYIALASNWKEAIYFPWTLMTYSFIHSDPIHLLMNMLVLHFSSTLFYTFFNNRQFLFVYFTSAVFCGLLYLVLGTFSSNEMLLYGSSGVVNAILFSVVSFAPNMQIRLPLIGNVKLWHIATFFLFIDLLYLLSDNTGGRFVHLSGALFGFIFGMLLKNGTDMSQLFSFEKKKKKSTFKAVHVNKTSVKKAEKTVEQKQVDEILDKISKSGYDSLTKEEKEFLFKLNN
jgi:membrane associated rhomboid family serine protease